MIQRSFKMRVLLWGWAIIIAVLGVVFYYSTTIVSTELTRETQEHSWRELDSVSWLIKTHPGFANEQTLDSWLDTLGEKLGARITYIVNGRVIADSQVPWARIPFVEDHSNRPEVLGTINDGKGMHLRYSNTVKQEMIYVATRIAPSSSLPGGVLRLAVPFSQVQSRVTDFRNNFLMLFFAAVVLAIATTALLSRRMSKSLNTFTDLAQEIGEGNYTKRIRVLPGGEFKPFAKAINSMADRIEKHVSTIMDQKGQLRAMFEGMSEGIMVLDNNGRINAYNRALDEIFSMPATSKGKTPIEVIRRYEIQEISDMLLYNRELDTQAVDMELDDGRIIEVSGVPYFDQNENRQIILVFHDITAIKRSEKALKDFVANASHQLRTPLTSIKGYAETLLESPPESFDAARHFLKIIVKNADHMSKVISSMLALAKTEQASKQLNLADVEPAAILDLALDDLEPLATEANVRLKNTVEGELPLVHVEPDGLLHVFHNLIQNAIKYSPENSTITISAEEEPGDVLFTVQDEGAGVPKGHSEKIFDRFYRVDGNTIDGHGSAGLGLSICRRIISNFDGEIWHDGTGDNERGARFRFRIPKA